MQPHSNYYSSSPYSNLAQKGIAILQSSVKPFYLEHQIPPLNLKQQHYPKTVSLNYPTNALVQKLTLKRLRKMQALVRGFLVRRITYPRLLKQYKVCSRVYDSVFSHVMLQQSSSMVLELISQNKNTKQFSYESKTERLTNSLTNKVIQAITLQLSKQVIATCISENIQNKNPAIKVMVAQSKQLYRLDLPEQRAAKLVINSYIDKIRQSMAKQIIAEVTNELRIQKIAEDYILKQRLLSIFTTEVYSQYMNQIIREQIANDIIEDSMEEFTKTLVKYQIKKYEGEKKEIDVKESEQYLVNLLIGQEVMAMIAQQQYFDD